MKKSLRLLSVFPIILLAAVMFFACSSEKNQSASESFEINNDFVIVRPARATDAELKATTKLFTTFQNLGISLTAQDDAYVEQPKHEILLGQTNRSQSKAVLSELGYGDYSIKVSGNAESGYKIAIAALTGDSLDAAIEYFITQYLTGDTSLKMSTDVNYLHDADYPCEKLTIAGQLLSKYKIVYAPESATNTDDRQIQAAKYADAAAALSERIYEVSGARLSVIPDTETVASSTPVILFGMTDHSDDNFAYKNAFSSAGAYIGKLLDNGSVVLAGDNACAVYAAGEAFVSALTQAKTELTAFDVAAEKDIIKVSCIGDSITYGTNSNDPAAMSYPVYLQRLLGYDYYVEKYGAPSHSLIESDSPSFLNHDYFTQSVNAAPDVVIVMLGTNDCRTQKWDDSAYKDWTDPARTENFLSSGEKLINAYRSANADVQIILATSPTVPQDEWLGTDWTARIKKYGNPLLKQLANELNCELIDVFSFSEDHPEMFEGGDGLHPQNEQYSILADGVYSLIKDIIKKPE